MGCLKMGLTSEKRNDGLYSCRKIVHVPSWQREGVLSADKVEQ